MESGEHRPYDEEYWARPWSTALFAGDLFASVPFGEQPTLLYTVDDPPTRHFLGEVAFGYGLLITPTCGEPVPWCGRRAAAAPPLYDNDCGCESTPLSHRHFSCRRGEGKESARATTRLGSLQQHDIENALALALYRRYDPIEPCAPSMIAPSGCTCGRSREA